MVATCGEGSLQAFLESLLQRGLLLHLLGESWRSHNVQFVQILLKKQKQFLRVIFFQTPP